MRELSVRSLSLLFVIMVAVFCIGPGLFYGSMLEQPSRLLSAGLFALAAFAVYWVPLWALSAVALAVFRVRAATQLSRPNLTMAALFIGAMTGCVIGVVLHRVFGPPPL